MGERVNLSLSEILAEREWLKCCADCHLQIAVIGPGSCLLALPQPLCIQGPISADDCTLQKLRLQIMHRIGSLCAGHLQKRINGMECGAW